MLLASLAGILFTLIGLYWVRESLIATRDAAIAARSSNEITKIALKASERAWVQTTVKATEAIRRDKSGAYEITLGILNKNIGNTPAINVSTNVAMCNMEDIENVSKQLIESSKKYVDQSGILLSPGESFDRYWCAVTAHGVDAEPLGYNDADYLVICVMYKTVFDENIHHVTSVYYVCALTTKGDLTWNRVSNRLPARRVGFRPWNGSSAN